MNKETPSGDSREQRQFLVHAKSVLDKHIPKIGWDQLAALAGIDARALKTYRTSTDSADYRAMPSTARKAIEDLLQKYEASNADDALDDQSAHSSTVSLVVPALAALVVRQARTAVIEKKMVAGIDWRSGALIGLRTEDRKAMALVSRACLSHGKTDYGSEIHMLLAMCTKPLGEWLDLPEVRENGLAETALVNADEGVPTVEAEEIAKGFHSMTATVEEQIFSRFVDLLEKNPKVAVYEYYTAIREFVVRHPIAVDDDFAQLRDSIPSVLMHCVLTQFYELVPDGWTHGTGVPCCAHCGNAMIQGRASLVCRTQACANFHSPKVGEIRDINGLYRLVRGIRQYWHEPGVDEIRFFDAMAAAGLKPELYPMRDRVDIAVGEIGIDLKAYSSPELLGAKFRKSLGGLASYNQKWLVIPDWLVARVPAYLDRLSHSLEGKSGLIRCLSVSQATKELIRA